MNVRAIISTTVLGLLISVSASAGQETPEDRLQAGIYTEEVQGNLEDAIAIYRSILTDYPENRAVGAKAQLHIGLCLEVLGLNEAANAYQRVITDYADQTESVAQARELLANLRGAARAGAEESRGITTRQVHRFGQGEAIPLAITPDGMGLVYADLWYGNLAIHDLTNEQSRILTHDAYWTAWAAAVSPDGRSISYLDWPTGSNALHLVGIDGSDPRILYREAGCDVSHHQWTSGGEYIVAVVQCGEDWSVNRISVPGGAVEMVAELAPARLEEEGEISLSPDDRYLTYGVAVEADGGNVDIRLLALDGGPDRPLVRHPANDQLVGWVPGTDEVLFLSDRDGTEDLWAIRVIDGAPDGPPRMVQRNMGRVGPLGFTSDGTLSYTIGKAVYSTGVAPFDLAAGTVTMKSAVGILGNNQPATWSPDGEDLAFVGEGRTLRIHHLDTGVERKLASHLWAARNQRWSPDGRFILFSAGLAGEMEEEEREPGLYLVDVESGQTTQVVQLDAESGSHPRWELGGEWSKDGTAIIYSLYNQNLGEGRLIWLDLESGEERELFRDPYLASQHFAVSPDGSRLVFALRGYREGNWAIQVGGRLLIMDLDDGDVREFHKFPEEGRVWSLQWTPDGKYVLYTTGEDDGDALWRVPVAGGAAEKTWTFEEDFFNVWANLSPDGRQVAYTTYRWDFEVWVMENFLPAGEQGGR